MFLTEPVFYRLVKGIVFMESASGKDEVCLSMPLDEFRMAIENGRQLLAEFDTMGRVLPFPRGDKNASKRRPKAP